MRHALFFFALFAGLLAPLNMTAGAVRREGGTTIDALVIAHGMIASGEVNPAFYTALAVSSDELAQALEGSAGRES